MGCLYNLMEIDIRIILPVPSHFMRTALAIAAFFCACLALTGFAVASERLPRATDLHADGGLAQAQRLPIVLFFHTTTCPYCRQVEDLYLRPLARENARFPRIILRAVDIDAPLEMKDFSGAVTDMRTFAIGQGVGLVPSIRFLGPDGAPLVPELLGYSSPDFYAGYLEDAIREATQKLRAPVVH
jgi:thiol-disulfide isomerase/thioredoxin